MDTTRLTAPWHPLAAAVLSGLAEWRLQHPTATLREIKAAIDAHLAVLGARMLQDAALTSAATELGALPAAAITRDAPPRPRARPSTC
jgi:hypothetical protein